MRRASHTARSPRPASQVLTTMMLASCVGTVDARDRDGRIRIDYL
jgi:hypothetical protein